MFSVVSFPSSKTSVLHSSLKLIVSLSTELDCRRIDGVIIDDVLIGVVGWAGWTVAAQVSFGSSGAVPTPSLRPNAFTPESV